MAPSVDPERPDTSTAQDVTGDDWAMPAVLWFWAKHHVEVGDADEAEEAVRRLGDRYAKSPYRVLARRLIEENRDAMAARDGDESASDGRQWWVRGVAAAAALIAVACIAIMLRRGGWWATPYAGRGQAGDTDLSSPAVSASLPAASGRVGRSADLPATAKPSTTTDPPGPLPVSRAADGPEPPGIPDTPILPPGLGEAFVLPTGDTDQYGNPVVRRDGRLCDPRTGWSHETWCR